ncbi:MAG: hypothetical protein K8I82_20460, partial [Anaerolineae bacterium]|nr:hypothetical protein [Anaerolineae bacterium]
MYEEIGFTSAFPDGVSAALEVTPQFRLKEVAFFMTMDEVVVYRSEVFIPAHQAGDSLLLTGAWNGVSVTGEISPPWTKMKSWWHLIDEAGNSVITEPAAHVYRVESARQWVKIEGQAATLYAYNQPATFLQQAVQIADDAMQQLSHSYGYSLPYRPAVVFYNSAIEGDADLSPFTRSAFGAYFGGRAYPGTGGVVALANLSDLPRVLPHELAHLFQFQLGGQFFDAPHWWREGDAKLHEPAETIASGLQRARELAFSGELPELTVWNELPAEKSQLEDMMSVGMSFVFFLQEQYGAPAHTAFYANWRQTRDFFATFGSTYGQTLADLDKQWRGWLLDIPAGQA